MSRCECFLIFEESTIIININENILQCPFDFIYYWVCKILQSLPIKGIVGRRWISPTTTETKRV